MVRVTAHNRDYTCVIRRVHGVLGIRVGVVLGAKVPLGRARSPATAAGWRFSVAVRLWSPARAAWSVLDAVDFATVIDLLADMAQRHGHYPVDVLARRAVVAMLTRTPTDIIVLAPGEPDPEKPAKILSAPLGNARSHRG